MLLIMHWLTTQIIIVTFHQDIFQVFEKVTRWIHKRKNAQNNFKKAESTENNTEIIQ